jgi:quercetin dioxygenase-like cupin family protein
MITATLNPRVLAPQAGERLLVAGDAVTFKAVGAETGGAYTLFEGTNAPGHEMPPHVHAFEEEAFFVLEGTYTFTLGEETSELGPGSFAFGPRGVPHGFRNSGPTPGRILTLVTPGGLVEQFFAEIGRPLDGTDARDPLVSEEPSPLDLARMIAVAEKYGIEFLPASER